MFVYKITNTQNGKLYIGVTIRTLENRWIRHKSSALKGSMSPIHRAIRKYGETNFTIELVEEVARIEELPLAEQKWIVYYNTFHSSDGYNATKGGDGTWGRIHSAETRAKIKTSLQTARDEGRFLNAAWYTNVLLARQHQVGVALSEQHKANISKATKGKPKNHMSGKLPIAVDQFSKDGELLITHISYAAAAKYVNTDASSIMKCCQGKRKTVMGFIFKYHKEQVANA